jgi:putative toxin-antitoxin system antitoxin component (TIGR02293 family)
MDKQTQKSFIFSWLEMPKKRTPSHQELPSNSTEDAMVLAEPTAVYGSVDSEKSGWDQISNNQVSEYPYYDIFDVKVEPMLTPQAKVPEFFMDNFEKSFLAKQGISKVSFENFKERAELDYNQFAKLLCVARNTLINKKGLETFDITISEKLIALAEVYTHGYDVFGSEPTFHKWLNHPNRALGGVIPFSLLDTQYGRQEVHTILGRIEWGVFS